MERLKVIKYNFDKKEFPFKKIFEDYIEKIFGDKNLDMLHNLVPDEKKSTKLFTVENDQDSWLHRILYNIDPFYDLSNKNASTGLFIKTYNNFISMLSKNFFKENIVYQKKPTIRIHLVNNLSVGGYHRDSEYNHPEEEFNIWVPLTNCNDTSSINIEQNYLKEDYEPFNAKFGEFAIFDGHLKHGNEINREGYI